MSSNSEEKKAVVNLAADMLNIDDLVFGLWGAMELEDNQLGTAIDMAKALFVAGGDAQTILEDVFFETIKPFMARMAKIAYHRRVFGLNRVLAILYDGLITQMAEHFGNDKETLLASAKARYPEFEWEFQSPWESPKDHKEPEQFVWPEWLM